MELFGKIVVIHSKYVILNEKKRIAESQLLYNLLPNDEVGYTIQDDQIHLTRLVHRKHQFFMAIVSQTLGQNISVFSFGLPKYFSPMFLNIDGKYKIEDALIIEATEDKLSVYQSFGSIRNRLNDKDLFLTLYRLNVDNNIPLIYEKTTNGYYTKPFQDLTHLYTFNVDPSQSKDFDDAISIDGDANKFYVHIVDANRIENEYERDAFNKSFTLYLPEHIENILPRDLAENKLSLIKGEQRYVITVEYTIDHNNEIMKYEIYPSVIMIKERYDYEQFMNVLSSYRFSVLQRFNNRWEKTTLQVPSVKIDIGKDSRIARYHHENNCDQAHKIIETMMILTNLTISKHVPHQIPQRFHNKVNKISKTIPSIQHITDNEMINAILMIKSYRSAFYDSENTGHFGLGLTTYTHFTSPIRRYFDVIIHRLLAGYTLPNMEEVLEHLNYREHLVDQLVKMYHLLKFLDYYDGNDENDNKKDYNAYVIQLTEKGVVVLIENFLYEVFVFVKNPIFSVGERVSVSVNYITWAGLSLSVKIKKK